MNRPLALAALLLALAGCSKRSARPTDATPTDPGAAQPETVAGTLAFTNVTVVDVVSGRSLDGQTVVVNGDTIAAVGDARRVVCGTGATVVDGTGKFLVPGLWDMHAHLADPAMPALCLRFGVTGVRHMYSIMRGADPRPKDLAQEQAAPTFPRLVAARNLIDGDRTGFPDLFQRNILFANTADEARSAVAEARSRGNDFIKVHSVLNRDAYFAVAAASREQKVPLAGHVPFSVTVAEASDAGQLTIEHLDGVAVLCSRQHNRHLAELAAYGTVPRDKRDLNLPWRITRTALETYDDRRATALFATFVKNGTWHTPTLVESRAKFRLGDPNALDPEVERLLPASAKLLWRRDIDTDGNVNMPVLTRRYSKAELIERKELFAEELKLLGAMHRANVRLLAGTDTPNVLVVPGLALHEELEIFVAAGLTPAEALRTATCNPAECLGLSAKHGSVAVGKMADLLLLTKDPLADIRNTRAIEAVFVGGVPVARPEPGK